MEARIIDSVWFNLVGIVKVQDPITNEIKFYIGQGNGANQEKDEEFIANWGSPFQMEMFKAFFEKQEVNQNT